MHSVIRRVIGSTATLAILAAAAPLTGAAAGPAGADAPPHPFENPRRDVAALKRIAALQARGIATTPDAVSQAEKDFNRALDAAIAPILETPLSADDGAALNAAFKALRVNDVEGARERMRSLSNPLARKLVTWDLLRRGHGTRAEIERFWRDNPLWPNAWKLVDEIEKKLFAENDHAATRAFFAGREPRSPLGAAALASALAAAGDRQSALALAKKAWRTMDFDSEQDETLFLARLGSGLKPADHKWRLDRLLTTDFRWSNSRNARAAVVRRQMSRVSSAERAIAEARLAVFLRRNNALSALEKLPDATAADWSLAYHRVQQLRRSGRETDAATLLLSAPTDTASIVDPDAWWEERRVNAYVALRKNNPELAYALVREAGDLSVNERKDQAFVAGWLALRYLGDTKAALRHFAAMVQAADGPLSRAKSAYWMARAQEAAGNAAEARRFFEQSAREVDTFHGQLSRQILAGGEPMTVKVTPPDRPSEAQVSRMRALDVARAAVIADRAGLGRTITRPFLANLATEMQSEAEVALVAHLTRALGDTQQSLRIGKVAIARGMNLVTYAYPLHAFPDYKPLRPPPETAFLLAIARQESEFNTEIVSGAGARGILQVMKVTARHVCRDYKIKCDFSRLLSDESYNTMIASAYIADRMGEFGGSYILGLAGYNAGPGRARQWIGEYGDPRAPGMDPMDWIERIPFAETREYVQKVLSNIQVYRARLGQKDSLRLIQDMRRAKRRTGDGTRLTAPGGRIAR